MGFRNPITTATAVDTGRGLSDAGVRLYEDTSVPSVPQGVAEWRTGLMDRNATVKLAGGGSGGSSWSLQGGSTEGTAAPEIDLNVEGLAAGGYGPVLRTKTGGGQWLTDTPVQLDAKLTALPLFTGGSYGFAAFDVPNSPAYGRLGDGSVQLEGIVKLSSGTIAAGASAQCGTIPAALAPARSVQRPVLILTSAGAFYAVGWLTIGAGGTAVTVWNTTGAALGAGASWTVGCTYTPAAILSN